MRTTSILFASLFLAITANVNAASSEPALPTAKEISAFFDGYLSVYNRRFGHPERGAQFRRELSEQVHMPFLQSPPSSAPRVPESVDSFTNNFEGFVKMLEQKGVTRLEWQRRDYQVLSAHKVLANNIGIGYTEDGRVAYETASLYLLYRTDAGWRITLFSPYDTDKHFSFGSR